MPDDPERDVDEEDPVPVEVLGEQAADHRPDREREGRDPGPDADRRAPLPGRERRRDDRERGRVHQRGTGPLEDAGGDQLGPGGGETAEERRGVKTTIPVTKRRRRP